MRRLTPLSLMAITAAAFFAVAWGVPSGEVWAQSAYSTAPGSGNPMAENTGQVLFWCAVLLGTAVVMGLAFFWLRKRLAAMDDESPAAGNPMGFTLADLRQMHDAGQISDEEFDFAKRKMLARAKAQLDGENADDAEEPEIEDLGDLTEATRPAEESTASESPDKGTSAQDPPDDGPADKNDGPDDDPPPDDGPPPPPKPPKHW